MLQPHYKNELDFIYYDYEAVSDSKYLVIHNVSRYMDVAPIVNLYVTAPGYIETKELIIPADGTFAINSQNILINPTFQDYVDLQDGVYKLRLSVCPHDTEFVEKHILRTHIIQNKAADLLTKMDFQGHDLTEDAARLSYVHTLLTAAKHSARVNNTKRALQLYQAADEIVTRITNVINRYTNGEMY